MIAHVAGAPVEELLPLLGGMGAAIVLSRAWVAARLRHRPAPAPDPRSRD